MAVACAVGLCLSSPSWAGWSEPVTASAPGSHAVFPDVAMNADGAAVVAWYNGAIATTEASIARPGGDFAPLVTVSKQGEFGGWPSVAMDAAGNAVVVFRGGSYQNPPEENGVKATFVSADGKVDGPSTIGTSTSGTIAYTGVGMDDGGDAIAWWNPANENRLMYAHRSSAGRFGAPTPIPNPASFLQWPEFAMSANGDAVAAWASRTQVYAAIRRGGGGFGPAEPLGLPVPAAAIAPRVAMAPNGAAVVAWVDRPDERGNGFVRASYRPPGGSFSPPRTLAEVFYTGVYDVAVAMSPAGEALVIWAGGTWVPRTDWFTTFVTKPPGGDFGPPREAFHAICEEPPQVAYDSAENAYAVCRRYYTVDEYNQPLGVAYGAIRPAGASSFGAPSALSSAGQNVWEPAVAAGPPGQAIVAWPRGWFPDAFHLEVARHSGSVFGPPAQPVAPQPPEPSRPRSPATGPPDLLGRLAARLSAGKGLGRRLRRGPVRIRMQVPAAGALGVKVLSGSRLLARGRVAFTRAGSATLVLRSTQAGRRALARTRPRLVLALTLHLAGQPRVHARLHAR
jgi:hypothetical protein